jgi:hypothetical protein
LFHGPNARQAALDKATEIGPLMAPPFGDNGLNVGDAREAVQVLMSTPIGDGVGTVIIGPVDEDQVSTAGKTTDVLLKIIEEFDGTRVHPLLWAHDLGSVSKTIRSRCQERWAPLLLDQDEDEGLAAAGWRLVEASLTGDYATIPPLVKEFTKKRGKKGKPVETEEDAVAEDSGSDENSAAVIKEDKDRGTLLLGAIADCLSAGLDDPAKRLLWEQVRLVARWKNPTPIEIIAALLRS